jgi:hypothetical protein
MAHKKAVVTKETEFSPTADTSFNPIIDAELSADLELGPDAQFSVVSQNDNDARDEIIGDVETTDEDPAQDENAKAGDDAADALAAGSTVLEKALAKINTQINEAQAKLDAQDKVEWQKFYDKEAERDLRAIGEKQLRLDQQTERLALKNKGKLAALEARKQQILDNAEQYEKEQAEKEQKRIDEEKAKLQAKIDKKAEKAAKALEAKAAREAVAATLKTQKQSENKERKDKFTARQEELAKFPGRRRKATDFIYQGDGFSTPQQFSIRGKVFQYLKDNYNIGDKINVELFGAEVKPLLYGTNVRSYLGKLEEYGQIDFITPVDVPVETESDRPVLHDDFADEGEGESDQSDEDYE